MAEAGPSTRPSTPPPRVAPASSLNLTPEQIKRIEINRLRAKARQREKEQTTSTSSATNTNNKRPLGVTPDTSKSPTTSKTDGKLRRDSRLGKYFDYDLSKMVNSKGGFLVEDGKEVDEELRAKEKERERQRARQNLDPPIFLDPSKNPKCEECGTVDIDHTFKKVFGCMVCNKCKNEKPERYSLLTKTECKTDYLLTDAELRDHDIMPHLLKANPHKSTFANMMLFLRYQVEEFAWKKWGSPEALDAEWEKRVAEKKKQKNKKFEEGLRELRRRTRETVWQKRKDEEHKHIFSCYFLLAASPAVPILYHVDRTRDGRSYCTRSVRAVQKGKTIFIMLCSFQRPEPWQPHNYQIDMPKDVPSYDECEDTEAVYTRYLKGAVRPELRAVLEEYIQERRVSPICIRHACMRDEEDGGKAVMTWFKARNMSNYTPGFQKCILSYISDSNFIGGASKALDISRQAEGDKKLSMNSTIDHSIWFYDDEFDCGDWLLYVVQTPRARSGRAVVQGRMYTKTGKLIAVTSQEGVVRVAVRPPPGPAADARNTTNNKAKL
ncbi:hypothetical protein EIP91_005067 [Steccherinum ochraceum]|uniref:DNA repair protein RAD14 n=1 Tax=Steccherinum ochraceum TaxID=92696 RepID=A0A4R0RU76_9APHY|nr:hypothetical protein EIP91_005067 [Steccherinum ochraceum]